MNIKNLFGPKNATLSIPELSSDESQLQAIINSLDSAVVLLETNGSIIFSNKVVIELFGFTKPPKHIQDIQTMLAESYNLASKFFSAAYAHTSVLDTGVTWESKYLKVSIAPVENVGYLLVIADQTNEMALNRSRDEFFSIASHELRTPLTIIKGNASMLVDILKQSSQDPNQQKIADDILSSSDRLIRIVNDLLEISELEQHKMKFAKEKIQLREVINKIVAEHVSVADIRHVKITAIGNEDVPDVVCDKARVEEVLNQLVDNALKNTENGKITISFSKVMGFVEVSVSDTGRGISSELQSLLFRKFQQAGGSLYARDVEGVGLGLYITKLLIEEMGGRIKLLTSTPGIGTTFSFTLPIQ
jgi:signal transduction histidine kinase